MIKAKIIIFNIILITLATYQSYGNPDVDTKVTKWKSGKQAAFMLMFDDSLPSHVQYVIPELNKRDFTGTFYINPGKYNFQKFKKDWEESIPQTGMSYGNHTFGHKSAEDANAAEKDIAQCNEVVLRINPPDSSGKLLSFAVPGVKVWNVSDKELATIKKRYNLIQRPTFSKHGAAVHCKTADSMCAYVDKAIEENSCEYMIFHGVGAEYLSVSQDDFIKLLDKLSAEKDKVWVASHIDVHKYETERDNATVKILTNSKHLIEIKLTSEVNQKLYDFPITLQSKVPENWKNAQIIQDETKTDVKVESGIVTYDAIPNKGIIKISSKQL